MAMSVDISKALKSNNPYQSLSKLIEAWKVGKVFADHEIVSELSAFYVTTNDESSKQFLIEAMKSLSSHLKQTSGLSAPEVQEDLFNALQSSNPLETLRTVVEQMRKKENIDDGGLLFELTILRNTHKQLDETQQDAVIDVMTDLYGW